MPVFLPSAAGGPGGFLRRPKLPGPPAASPPKAAAPPRGTTVTTTTKPVSTAAGGTQPAPAASASPRVRTPTREQREAALARSKGPDGVERCTHCDTPLERQAGKPNSAEIDHRKPFVKGGQTTDSNLDAACRTCNRSKGPKELGAEWTPPNKR
ncbi:HNH endonuclease [Polyangium fumosum]|uniref:HNH endonuclease n=2 Tax=Polyangium fumosum TaxID=889272 RepID=A0A4U1JAK8_9BACT|nr:HNH endonuclease [Polyangium fumosum]